MINAASRPSSPYCQQMEPHCIMGSLVWITQCELHKKCKNKLQDWRWIHNTHPSDSDIKCDTDIGTSVVTSDYLCPGSAVRIQTCDWQTGLQEHERWGGGGCCGTGNITNIAHSIRVTQGQASQKKSGLMLTETNIKINGGATCAVRRLITIRGSVEYGYIQSQTALNHHNVIIIMRCFSWTKRMRAK